MRRLQVAVTAFSLGFFWAYMFLLVAGKNPGVLVGGMSLLACVVALTVLSKE